MILFVGKKAKRAGESPINREREIEAEYYARKCGLTRDEALKIIKDARPAKQRASLVGAKTR
ncbi:hypothetical protein DBIPINDM_005794 [Mesorhizobium sp. AR02]|uniref:hypothetical protein n=1 Tax=Mesorhizobium sp. AR02 TaxID=2865837 RepID=UPI0021603CE8|nr:hypothetical protein [Mesorhizobium sp. AR02]UVK52423.1 hypothetical protein DBIPINDM_005794 [Mesorhizobium sp. AR02]